MTEKEIERLKKFRELYEYSQGICDPIEFMLRQKNMLANICHFILEPLIQHEKEIIRQSMEQDVSLEEIKQRESEIERRESNSLPDWLIEKTTKLGLDDEELKYAEVIWTKAPTRINELMRYYKLIREL